MKIVKDSPGRGRKRAALAAVLENEEMEGQAEKIPKIETPDKLPIKTDPADRIEQRTTRLSKQQTTPKDLQDPWREPKPPREIPSSLSSPGRGLARDLARDTTCDTRGDVRASPRSHSLRELRVELVEDSKRAEKAESPASILAECKSELSDRESSQVRYHNCSSVSVYVRVKKVYPNEKVYPNDVCMSLCVSDQLSGTKCTNNLIFMNSALRCTVSLHWFSDCVYPRRATQPAVLLGRRGKRERGGEGITGPNRTARSTQKTIGSLCGTGEAKTSRLMRQRL